jgi:Hypothetical protein (DUF2513)
MDIVRTILLRIEASPLGWTVNHFGIEGFTREQVVYHAHIMREDGLIEVVDGANFESKALEVMPHSLTWKGHEFLDLARDLNRWYKAKAIISKIGTAPISVWTKVLNDLILRDLAKVS